MSVFSRAEDYYPLGAYNDPSAPWNEESIPEKDFDVNVWQTLQKPVTITTDMYDREYDEEDGSTHYDTSMTNWKEEFHNNDYHTPLQLLGLFKQYLQENLDQGIVFKSPRFTEDLIEECSGWEEVDMDFEY